MLLASSTIQHVNTMKRTITRIKHSEYIKWDSGRPGFVCFRLLPYKRQRKVGDMGVQRHQCWAGMNQVWWRGEQGSQASWEQVRKQLSHSEHYLSVSAEMCFSQSQMTKLELKCGQVSKSSLFPAGITTVYGWVEQQMDILEENLVQKDKFLCWLQTQLSMIQPSEYEIVAKRGG